MLSATYRPNNFQFIARTELRLRENAPRHDLAVTLDRQTFACQAKFFHQLANRELGNVKITWITVDSQMDQLSAAESRRTTNQPILRRFKRKWQTCGL